MERAAALRFSAPGSLLLVVMLGGSAPLSAQFTVVGPTDAVLAMAGENTKFHCHLSPEKDAEHMEVRWFRSQFSLAVLVYKAGRERTEEQMEEYQGRTTFVSEHINKGSVALIIHNVTAHDNGIYHCYFQEGRSYDEAVMHLMVAKSFVPSTFPWMVSLAAVLPSLLLFSAGSICLVRKLHRGKEVENEAKEVACEEPEKEQVEKEKERQIREQLQEELRKCAMPGGSPCYSVLCWATHWLLQLTSLFPLQTGDDPCYMLLMWCLTPTLLILSSS
uniref:Butyrophilin subfamily 2 member A2 n=2 Tax=Canis lupus familiaris TaxID=9615 RepID=A0A8I3NZU2_CANLF